MRSLKKVYPAYADSVDFYAINVDPSDGLDDLAAFGEKEGYPWPIAQSDSDVLFKLHVTRQSTKIAFDANGVIVYRARMGDGDAEEWRSLFEDLSAG